MVKKGNNQNGFMLVAVMLALLAMAIFLPSLVEIANQINEWALQYKRSTTAFHMAESGIERGEWKFLESSIVKETVSEGGVILGYDLDKVYKSTGSDDVDGEYKVRLTTTATDNQVKIISIGRDKSTNEVRAIEVVYQVSDYEGAIIAPTLQFNSSFKVFWGGYYSLSDIDLNSSADQLYPRKFARTSITSSSSYGDRDNDPNTPNTDCLEYWAYDDSSCGSNGVPDMPIVDVDWYREQSLIPPNEYYDPPGNGTETFNNLQDNVPIIRFIEDNVSFSGTMHARGIIVALGKVTIHASGYDDDAYGSYTVFAASEIPTNAWEEHQVNTPETGHDTGGGCTGPCNGGGEGKDDDSDYDNDSEAEADDLCCDQYPADGGYHTVTDYNFKTGCIDHPGEFGGHSGEPIAFKGLIYSGGQCDLGSSTVIHGMIIAPGGFKGTSSGIMFYDNTVDVQLTNSDWTRLSWREVKMDW